MARAGCYRHLVRVQKRLMVSDGQGGVTENWTTIDEVRAEVTQTAGTEFQHAGQLTWTQTYRVLMRWRGDLTPAQRLLWEDDPTTTRILDVLLAFNPDGVRRELLLTCIERHPDPGILGS